MEHEGHRRVQSQRRETTGAERAEIWERQKAAAPVFADYEVKAGERVIPVVVLEPAT